MKFLEDPYQTMGAGFALTVILVILFLAVG
jgi:hypothetical protein